MRDRQILFSCAFGLFGLPMLLMGCGGGQPTTGKTKPPSPPPPQSRVKASSDSPVAIPASGAYPEDQATTQLVGTVRLVGSPPTPKNIDVSMDAACKKMHEGGVLRDGRLVVGATGELANVLVYVSSGLDAFTFMPPQEPVLLDQKGCEYVPRVFGLMVGQTVRIRNSDATLHNVNCQAKVNIPFNFSQAKQGEEQDRSFDEPESPMVFKCDVHPWMKAYGAVFTHPFFAVTGTDGAFALPKKLLPGKYKLTAWHEVHGARDLEIEIDKRHSRQELNVEFKP